MARNGKVAGFYREGNDWFYRSDLPSDICVTVDKIQFHLHKFPLTSKCGKISKTIEESENTHDGASMISLEGFPGGADSFLVAAKFCYGVRVEFTPRNIVMIYCAADYLEMTDEYGEANLLSKSESFFHKNVIRNWKNCIFALQSCDPILQRADDLQIISKMLDALSMMVCTDPSLFGWPMMMYGRLQSPGGGILWNGINTGARIRTSKSDWWFEDISFLSIELFQRLIKTMEARGIRPENLAAAIMYFAKKYLPGLGRWQGKCAVKPRTLASFSMTPAAVDQRLLLEIVEKLLPEKKGKSYCRFLLGLLRVGLILGVSHSCKDSLERRIGMQLELATLDSLLIPTYADSDMLYNTDCVEGMINYFLSSERMVTPFSPSSLDLEMSPSSRPLREVAKLVDGYIAEVASDVNLKPEKIRSLAGALPESSRSLYDGLYRALDIYFKAHPWLSENEKEMLCNIIVYEKLSIDACAHASQNERLPLRIILQVLFFEQLQLRTALAGCLHVLDAENASAGQIVPRDGLVPIVRENRGLKVDLDRMRSRVGELEEEFGKMKEEMKRVTKPHTSLDSPRLVARKVGFRCNLLSIASDAQTDVIESTSPSPRSSFEKARPSRHSRH